MAARRFIKFEVEDRVGVLTIDNPPVNALSQATLGELDSLLHEIERGDDVRALVVTGAGEMFVAGADIRELGGMTSLEQAAHALGAGQGVLDHLDTLPIPVIAAVNGPALGGGCELVQACDLRIAGDRARFGQPEINLGLIPGFGGTQRLTRLVGTARALEIMLSGTPISAQDALRYGLVNKVVPDGTAVREACALGRLLAAKPTGSVRAILTLAHDGYGQSLPDALAMEREQFSRLVGTPDMREGIRAFLEKREPKFQ